MFLNIQINIISDISKEDVYDRTNLFSRAINKSGIFVDW